MCACWHAGGRAVTFAGLSSPMLLLIGAALAQDVEEATWRQTLEAVVPGVVSLKVSGTRSFDTESNSSSVGTGFVVDAEEGLILTNRHMVHAGPVRAQAVFVDHEEVDLQAIYRDPVHDFGVYRFDPDDLRYMELTELELAPERAEVGMEIRVVGNDAGEKIVILDGTIARVDRRAPVYGGNTYNDFNTFYMQAGSGTSGGSSGSPVVDVDGKVVALNAGGHRSAASSYYLPLDRVVRALELIQSGEPVERGTVQATFEHASFDELRRLGLPDGREAETRESFPDGHGLLVVRGIVPEGPADGRLAIGDILLSVDGEPLDGFVPLEAVLDEHVGDGVVFGVERAGVAVDVELEVGDLHAITPSSYLEVGGAILHPLSYQQARNHLLPTDSGVYVAAPGYLLREAGVPDGAVLVALDGEPIESLEHLEELLASYSHRARVPVRYVAIDNPRRERISIIQVDRLWYPMRRCVRDDDTGLWPCTDSADPPEFVDPVPGTAALEGNGSKAAARLARSLVVVECDLPYRSEGVSANYFAGSGLVVNASRGLVVADRDTVPVGLGEITLVFGGSLRVPAQVELVHPEHGIALLSYDPALLGDTPVQSAELSPKELDDGDPLVLVGITRDGRVRSKSTSVARIDPVRLPLPSPPQFRETNLDSIETSDSMTSIGGVLTDKKGRVHALWASFAWHSPSEGRQSAFRGLPIEHVVDALDALDGELSSLGVEWGPRAIADARDRGLSNDRAEVLAEHDPERRQVLEVVRVWADVPAEDLLQGGDLLLEVDGEPASRFREVEVAAREGGATLLVLRDGQEVSVEVPSVPLRHVGLDELLIWGGMLLHEPHHEVAAQRGIPREGVYVAFFWYGTPAQRYGMRATWRITRVDDIDTPDLPALIKAIEGRSDGESVRLTVVDLDQRERVVTIVLDEVYWPTMQFARDESGWERVAP